MRQKIKLQMGELSPRPVTSVSSPHLYLLLLYLLSLFSWLLLYRELPLSFLRNNSAFRPMPNLLLQGVCGRYFLVGLHSPRNDFIQCLPPPAVPVHPPDQPARGDAAAQHHLSHGRRLGLPEGHRGHHCGECPAAGDTRDTQPLALPILTPHRFRGGSQDGEKQSTNSTEARFCLDLCLN